MQDSNPWSPEPEPADVFLRRIKEHVEQPFRAKVRRACAAAFEDAKAKGASATHVRNDIAELLGNADVAQAFESTFGPRQATIQIPDLLKAAGPTCPKCNQNAMVVPIYYGLLRRDERDEAAFATVRRLYELLQLDASKAAERYFGFVAGGCFVQEENRYCRACHHRFVDRQQMQNYGSNAAERPAKAADAIPEREHEQQESKLMPLLRFQRRPARKCKVLVADIEQAIAEAVARMLDRYGYEAAAVYNGASVVEFARDWKPDLVLSEVIMGKMNGVKAAMRVRELLPDCKILLWSAQAGRADLLEDARVEGQEFELWAKPVHPADLLDWCEVKSGYRAFRT